ncbi:MAG: transposase [Sphingomonadaceae bacterium]
MSKKDAMKKKPKPVVAAAPAVAIAPPLRMTYTKEFKLAALARMGDGLQSSTALAMELGIRRNQLYKWAALYDVAAPAGSFKGPGRPPAAPEEESSRLRRELATAKEELAILKKFHAYLARSK